MPTGYVMHKQAYHSITVRSAYTLFVFLFIWEKTATCATYIINWFVFITEMKSVYSAVRTGPLNKAAWTSSVKAFKGFAFTNTMMNLGVQSRICEFLSSRSTVTFYWRASRLSKSGIDRYFEVWRIIRAC
jgi:hypothetical protein